LDETTYILRENLCDTPEAPFMYLLIGKGKAMLIDTGDLADPARAPLAKTVLGLLPVSAAGRLPLLVVHTHKHLDHRRGDPQFDGLAGVEWVPPDLERVRAQFHFPKWPEGVAQVDLGERVVDVLPAPGHHPAHLLFYDRRTAILFSGDFLMPARILVDDLGAYRASADRALRFFQDRPVSMILGGHIEKNRAGEVFPWQSTWHPDEAPLALGKADLQALPAALAAFNGLYREGGGFVIENPTRLLGLMVGGLVLALAGAGYGLFRLIRRRRRRRLSPTIVT
jgi:glyoxylase-like metal-dependent hydrolase (beta-lactamase superfamily II)